MPQRVALRPAVEDFVPMKTDVGVIICVDTYHADLVKEWLSD